jgi:hypothetical protein
MVSNLPFCEEVYEQDMHIITPVSGEECVRGDIIEHMTIVDGFHGAIKLCGDISIFDRTTHTRPDNFDELQRMICSSAVRNYYKI